MENAPVDHKQFNVLFVTLVIILCSVVPALWPFAIIWGVVELLCKTTWGAKLVAWTWVALGAVLWLCIIVVVLTVICGGIYLLLR